MLHALLPPSTFRGVVSFVLLVLYFLLSSYSTVSKVLSFLGSLDSLPLATIRSAAWVDKQSSLATEGLVDQQHPLLDKEHIY